MGLSHDATERNDARGCDGIRRSASDVAICSGVAAATDAVQSEVLERVPHGVRPGDLRRAVGRCQPRRCGCRGTHWCTHRRSGCQWYDL